MPTNDIQWLWFAFYTGGALGGYVTLICLALDAWVSWRRGR